MTTKIDTIRQIQAEARNEVHRLEAEIDYAPIDDLDGLYEKLDAALEEFHAASRVVINHLRNTKHFL